MVEVLTTLNSCEVIQTILAEQGERGFRILVNTILDNECNVYASIALYEDITKKLLLERDLHQVQIFKAVGQVGGRDRS